MPIAQNTGHLSFHSFLSDFLFLPFPRNIGTTRTHIVFFSILLCGLEAKQEDTGVARAIYTLPWPARTEGSLTEVRTIHYSWPHWWHDRAGAQPTGVTWSLWFPSLIFYVHPSAIPLHTDNSKAITSKGTLFHPWPPAFLITCSTQLDMVPQTAKRAPPSHPASKNTKPREHNVTHILTDTWEWRMWQESDDFCTSTEFIWWKTVWPECEHVQTQAGLSGRASEEHTSATQRHPSVLLAQPTCLKSRVIVTQWYSLPFWILGLCHQLLVPSIACDIGWRSAKRKNRSFWLPNSKAGGNEWEWRRTQCSWLLTEGFSNHF